MFNFEIFVNEVFGELTALSDNTGTAWFVANEVAAKLGYSDLRNALKDHVDVDDKKSLKLKDFSGRGQNVNDQKLKDALWKSDKDRAPKTIISEAGLYSLILGSKLDSAKVFKKWVTHDVLPAIRRTGMYFYGMEAVPVCNQQKLVDKILDAYKRDSSDMQEQYDKLLEDYIKLNFEYKELKKTLDNPVTQMLADGIEQEASKVYRVDSEGWILPDRLVKSFWLGAE